MKGKQQHTTARQLIGWLGEDKVNAGDLASRMEKLIARSGPGTVALRRLFRFDESLNTHRRKQRKTMAEEYFEKFGRDDFDPPKSALELMERQWAREDKRERQYKKERGWATNLRWQISEAVKDLEKQGLL